MIRNYGGDEVVGDKIPVSLPFEFIFEIGHHF